MWPTLPRLRLSTSHQHWWSLELSISPRTVNGKGVGSGADLNRHGWMKDGWKMVMAAMTDGLPCFDMFWLFKHYLNIFSIVVDPCQRLSVNSKEVVNSRNFAILRSSKCSVPRSLFKENDRRHGRWTRKFPNVKVHMIYRSRLIYLYSIVLPSLSCVIMKEGLGKAEDCHETLWIMKQTYGETSLGMATCPW